MYIRVIALVIFLGCSLTGTGQVKYQNIYNFSDGVAKVLLNDKWGFIDKKGKVVIPFMFDFR